MDCSYLRKVFAILIQIIGGQIFLEMLENFPSKIIVDYRLTEFLGFLIYSLL